MRAEAMRARAAVRVTPWPIADHAKRGILIAPGSVQTVALPDDATLVIPITGMTCTACEDRVRRAIAATPGIILAEVSLVARSARVTLEAPESQLAAALDAIRTAGYEPTATVEHILAHRTAAAAARLELDRQRRDASLAVLALAIAVLQLLFGMPFMAHGGAMAPSLAGPAMHPMLAPRRCSSASRG